MAKPDMSRNKDLAGKTVSKGGYNICLLYTSDAADE